MTSSTALWNNYNYSSDDDDDDELHTVHTRLIPFPDKLLYSLLCVPPQLPFSRML